MKLGDILLGNTNDIFSRQTYNGQKLQWTDDDWYDKNDDDAYRRAVWMIGTKTYKARLMPSAWSNEIVPFMEDKYKKFVNSYPEFGMPSSTEELKLKLEVLNWSIL